MWKHVVGKIDNPSMLIVKENLYSEMSRYHITLRALQYIYPQSCPDLNLDFSVKHSASYSSITTNAQLATIKYCLESLVIRDTDTVPIVSSKSSD